MYLNEGSDVVTHNTTGQYNKEQDEKVLELIDAGFVPDELELAQLYDPRSQYKPQEKVKACAYYMVYGNSKEVSKRTGLPDYTVRRWKANADWWIPTMAWLKKQRQDELDVMLTNIIHEASAGIHDRLTLGDTYVAKDGSHKRIPVKAKDLAYISSIMFDKRALMRGDITSNPGAGGNQLEEIQKQLVKTIQAAKEKDVVASVPKE
jgi:hypothetical protein